MKILSFLIFFLLLCSVAQAADRYWVGGTGNWSDTAHWSDADAGTGGFSVPTSADNANFSAGSFSVNGNTVTVDATASCNAIDFSGLDQTMTFTSSANSINIYGAITLSSKLTWTFTGTAYTYFKATTAVNLTINGAVPSFNVLYMNGVGGKWTLQDNMDCGTINPWYFVNGEFDTNNKSITRVGADLSWQSSAGTKKLTLGSSVITLGNGVLFGDINDAGLTVDAGTSTIKVYGDWFTGATKTFYNVEVNTISRLMGGSVGGFTCNNLTRTSGASTNGNMPISSTITVNNALTLTGNNASNYRLIVASSTTGAQRTINTPAGNVTASNVDFRDIKFTNAVDLSSISGGSGDGGGNSGITFTTAVPQFFKHTSGAVSWSDPTKWFTATNGGGSAGRVPLPQDDATFDANSFSGSSTLTVNCPRIGKSLDMTGVNQAVAMSLSNDIENYGSYVLGSNITPSGNYTLKLFGRGSSVLNPYEKTLYQITFYSNGGTYTLQSNLTLTGGIDNYGAVTFDVNDYNVNMGGLLNFSRGYAATVYLGNGTLTSTRSADAGSTFSFASQTTVYAEGSTLVLASTGTGGATVLFQGGGKTFNNVQFSGTHDGYYNIEGANTFNNLKIDAGRKVRFTAGTTTTISSLTAVGTAASPITISSVTGATHTISAASGRIDATYANISYSIATGGATFKAHASTDGGNNTGWTFPAARFWVGGSGTWDASDTTHWASSSGGSSGASVPTSSNDVYFDAGSLSSDGSAVTIGADANMANLDLSALSKTMTIVNSTSNFSVYGHLTEPAAKLTYNFSGTGYFYSRGSGTYTTNGLSTHGWNKWYIDGAGITVTNGDDMNMGGTEPHLVNGTWSTNNKTITTTNALKAEAGTRTLNLGSSTFNASGFDPASTLTLNAGASTVNLSLYIRGDFSASFYNVNFTGGTASYWISSTSAAFHNLTITGPALTTAGFSLYGTTDITVTNALTLTGSNATNNRLLVAASTLGTQRTITVPAVGVTASNVDFRDIKFTNAVDLSSISGGSGDGGGNSGVTLTTAVPQFFKHTSGAVNWSDPAKWFTATNGGGSAGRVPLPQDDATFDVNSFSGSSTLTVNCPRIGKSLDMTGVNKAVTFSVSNNIDSYGSFVLGPNISVATSSYQDLSLLGRGSYNISTYNNSNNQVRYIFDSRTGTYTLQSDLYFFERFSLVSGTLDLNDFNTTGDRYGYWTVGSGSTLYMGNGTLTIKRNYSAGAGFGNSGTIFCEGSTIKYALSSADGTWDASFGGGGKTYNKLWISGTHTGNHNISGSNTFNQIRIDPGRKVRFTGGTTTTVSSIIWDGTAANPIDINVVSGTTPWTISRLSGSQTFSANHLILDYSTATQANTFYAGSDSSNGGHNTNWLFGPPPGTSGTSLMTSD